MLENISYVTMAYDLEESQDYLRIKLPWPACLPASCLMPHAVAMWRDCKTKKSFRKPKTENRISNRKTARRGGHVIVFSICPDVRVSPATCVCVSVCVLFVCLFCFLVFLCFASHVLVLLPLLLPLLLMLVSSLNSSLG